MQKELRKLHLRWWHASEPKTRQVLQSAGIDEVRLLMIKPIVDTCRECRVWQKRGHEIKPSMDITIKWLEKGETDLMFYKSYIGFHVIDRALRFSGGMEIPDKFPHSLLKGYKLSWFQHYGPFKTLYSDGEKGWDNKETREEMKRLGTDIQIRAPQQHARLAEARQAMLRHVMHLIEEDLARFGITLDFDELYAEALYVVNVFSFYNGVSPYNSLYGRQPPFLPDLENLDFPKKGEDLSGAREQRIREAGIEAITQSTAKAKITRALSAKTTHGGRQFKEGDLIDYHRPTPTKDSHGGWNGPYKVTFNEPERGQLRCIANGREIYVRYPDARHSLYIEILMRRDGFDHLAMDTFLDFVKTLQAGKPPMVFGYTPLVKDGEIGRAHV